MKTAFLLLILCGSIACSSNKTKQEMKISVELDVSAFSAPPGVPRKKYAVVVCYVLAKQQSKTPTTRIE